VHVERRRPHDAEARHEAWSVWTNDRLNHDVAPGYEALKRQIAPPTLSANRSIRRATTT